MGRKRKATELKPSTSDASAQSTTSSVVIDNHDEVDWSTIDQRGGFDGFTLKAVKLRPRKESAKLAHKKQKTSTTSSRRSSSYRDAPLDADVSQENPYPETDLSEIYCKIEPVREWESTQRYRKFTITGEEFEVNQFIFVKKEAEDHDTSNAIQYWIAKVLEVRAGDAQHVYLRIYWAYRPEDLPGGRQPHHGECELIVSNHMDVIDALCVQGTANLIYWDDSPDSSTFPAPDQLYWRQSLDINKRKGHQVTKLNKYCLDKKPSNPDEPLIQCPSCSGYLHARCLEERAVEAAYKEHEIATTDASASKPRRKPSNLFDAEVSTTPDEDKLRLTVTDKRDGWDNRHWDVDIGCLLCKSIIVKVVANDSTPKTPAGQTADKHDEEEEGEKREEEEINAACTLDAVTSDAPGDVPTSATITAPTPIAKAKRPRGRPRGVKNKKRGRLPMTPILSTQQNTQNSQPEDSALNIQHEPAREKNSVPRNIVAQAQTTPPPAAALPANVFQSGVRSVKRLLHWEFTS